MKSRFLPAAVIVAPPRRPTSLPIGMSDALGMAAADRLSIKYVV